MIIATEVVKHPDRVKMQTLKKYGISVELKFKPISLKTLKTEFLPLQCLLVPAMHDETVQPDNIPDEI